MLRKIVTVVGVLVLVIFGAALAMDIRGASGSPRIPEMAPSLSGKILGFGGPDTPENVKAEIKAAAKDFESARTSAVERAKDAVFKRDFTRLTGHVISGFALCISFAIALLSATVGAAPGQAEPQLDKTPGFGRARYWVLALAAGSTFCVGAADRLSAYSASEAESVNEIVKLVTSSDLTVSRALSPAEVSDAAKDLQISMLKI